MTIPVYSSTGGAVQAGATNTVDVPYPATVNAGDFLVLLAYARELSNNTLVDVPSGWTEFGLAGGAFDALFDTNARFFWKRAAGTEGGTNQTITAAYDGTSSRRIAGQIWLFTGVLASGTPHENYAVGFVAASTTLSQRSITTTDVDRLCVHITAKINNSSTTPNFTGETGGDFAEGTDANPTGVSFQMQKADKATAGTISGGTATIASAARFTAVFALLPTASTNSGDLAKTLDAATLSAQGALAVVGSAAPTLAAATLASAGRIDDAGQVAATLAAATTSASSALTITGSLSVTLAPATCAAAGAVPISGATSATFADATLAAASSSANAGALGVTLDDVTPSGTGALPVAGALSGALQDTTLAAQASLPITGQAAPTLGDATLVAQGGNGNSGALSALLADASLAASASIATTGNAAPSLGPATVASASTLAVTGAAAMTLAPATVQAAGALANSGSVSASLSAATVAANGTAEFRTGELDETLGGVTAGASGGLSITGSLSATLANATLTARGGRTTTTRNKHALAVWRAIEKEGDVVTLARIEGSSVNIKAVVRDYSASELVEPLIQGDRTLVLSPIALDNAGWIGDPPKKNDVILTSGEEFTVVAAEPVWHIDQIAKWRLSIRGEAPL